LKTVIAFYHSFENAVMVALMALLTVLSFYQVGGRLFFSTGIASGDTIIYHLVLWTGLWGAILATREKQHITIDVVNRLVSDRYSFLIQTITNLFSAVICGLLTWASVLFIRDEIRFTDTTILTIPLWYYQLIIPYTFMVIGLRFLIHSGRDFLDFRSSPEKDDA
jgi:TRAP-type C4-dicarboxylate transport system permease small subunit